MSLFIVATPIGNYQDITERAKELLQKVNKIILEERKEGTKLLRYLGISGKEYYQLNEHTTDQEALELAELCAQEDIALISDCGTPGFCDPGFQVIRHCRQKKIPVSTLPGASSLMSILSLSSERLTEFVFRGFLPAENEARAIALQKLRTETRAIVLMDTPYRFKKMLAEIAATFAKRRVLITADLTQVTEKIWEGVGQQAPAQTWENKAEFMILIYAEPSHSVPI